MAAKNYAAQIATAKKAGYSDEEIVKFLAAKPDLAPKLAQAAEAGYSPEETVRFLSIGGAAAAMEDPTTAPELKPNDTLGFVQGGSKMFNNVSKWGGDALRGAGVDPKLVRKAGKAIRQGADVTGIINEVAGTDLPELIPGRLPNRDQLNELNQLAAATGQRPGRLGEFTGEVASSIPVAVGSAALAPEALAANGIRVGSPLAARALATLSGRGFQGAAAQGALQGALNTDNPEDAGAVATDAVFGGAGGLGGETLNRTIGGFIAPRFGKAMQDLIGLGQRDFSPAQLTGVPALRKLEDAGRSSLVLGNLIEGAQDDAQRGFNRAYLQRVSDEAGLGYQVPEQLDRNTYGAMKDAFNQNYGNQFNQASLASDRGLFQSGANPAIQEVLGSAGQTRLAQDVDSLFNPQYNPQTLSWSYGNLNGPDIKAVDQALRAEAKALRNPGPGQSVTHAMSTRAQQIEDARQALRAALSRQQPNVAKALEDLDKGYAMFKRSQEASTSGAGKIEPGQFTAEALRTSTYKAAGPNQRASLGSSGDIPGQNLADSAVQVMGNRVADSGTALRTAIGRVVGVGAEGAAGVGVAMNPALLAMAAPLYGAYLPQVRRSISRQLIDNSQNPMLQSLRRFGDNPAINNLLRATYNPAGSQVLE